MTDRLTDEQIKELERLDAWPRPWRTYTSTEGDESDIVADNAAYPDEIAHLAEFADERDARLAVLAVNALPSLIAEILASRAARAESEGTPGVLPPEIREILRDAAWGVTGAMIRERASAALVQRGLCPRCAGTGMETLDTGPGGCAAWGTCYGCAPASRDGQARTLPVRTARRLSGDDLRDAARRLSPQPAMEDYEDASRDGRAVTNPGGGVLLALAAKWRSEGEYWNGTPDDAARQQCADDLLTVLGVDPREFAMGADEERCHLARFGLPCHPSAGDREFAASRDGQGETRCCRECDRLGEHDVCEETGGEIINPDERWPSDVCNYFAPRPGPDEGTGGGTR